MTCGQNETAVWYFGGGAGLDFNGGEPVVLTDGVMQAEAGCAVISDSLGQLLFYTNGKSIWNRDHQRMSNGFGLNGSELVNQNSVIIPKPKSSSLYYVFTINAYYDSVGLNYSLIDMELDGGKGDVDATEKNVFLYRGFMEKITAVNHCNEEDVWIIGHNRSRSFYSFLLSADGISSDTVESNVGSKPKSDIGYLKVSPMANRIALPINNETCLLEVLQFDDREGTFSNPLSILKKHDAVYAYGIEFSPDGSLLYVSTGGSAYEVWQYDLSLASETLINESGIQIASGNNFAMQQAMDGKIYIAKENRSHLNRINYPNRRGVDCGFEENAIYLGGRESKMGLPNFQQSFFLKPSFSVSNTCFGDSCQFNFWANDNIDYLKWNFGDQTTTKGSPIPDTPNPTHYYSDTGTYHVQLIIYHCNVSDTIYRTVNINPYPQKKLGPDTTICSSCSIELNSGWDYDDLIWQDGSQNQYMEARDSGWYWVQKTMAGCTSTDSLYISKYGELMFFPTAFTPNGDGLNDVFKVVGKDQPSDYRMIIFNRWGNLVYESNDYYEGWDGTHKNQNCQAGNYIWKMTYSVQASGQKQWYVKEGSLMLIR